MKRRITIVLEFDDTPEIVDGVQDDSDPICYAMDRINDIVIESVGEEFVEARLDEELFVDNKGYASEDAKRCKWGYERFKRWLNNE